MKKIITLALILFLGLQTVNAQLGRTRSEITEKFGENFYKTGRSNEGDPYIIYKTEDSSATSGSYAKTLGFYFRKSDDGTEYCNEQLIMEPLSELNNWVEYYKSKYEEIGNMKYRDNTNKVIFKVSVIDNHCAVRMWYE